MKRTFTEEHRNNISKACKGRVSPNAGKKASKEQLFKNMAAHIRVDVEPSFYLQFDDAEKVKLLNDCITNRSGRFDVTSEWYAAYIKRFYYDRDFNAIYEAYVRTGDKYMKPSIDHIVPTSKGGTNDLGNIRFLTWFENRCKNDIPQCEWDGMRARIAQYFIRGGD